MILSSKFTFSLIVIASLLVSGSGLMAQDAFAATDAPEFTAIHWNTTATQITFDKSVNGTLRMTDWHIMIFCAAVSEYCTEAETATDGSALGSGDIAISNIYNGSTTPGAKDIVQSGGAGTKGFINDTTTLFLIHAAIPSDASYYVNFTNTGSLADSVATGQFHEYLLGRSGGAEVTDKVLKIGSNATAADYMSPTVVSAEKTGPKKIAVLMSESVANINSTGSAFVLSGLHDSVVSSLIATNSTNTIYLTTRNLIDPINVTPAITLSYNSDADDDNVGIDSWITDGVNSGNFTTVGDTGTAIHVATGHGNRLYNFTGLVVTYPTDFSPDAQRYPPHIHDEVSVSINSDELYDLKIHDNITSNILANVGDTISVTVSVGDDYYLSGISRATLITNYDHEPSGMNQYYSPNHDELGQTGLSVYEWNQNTFDQKYDYAGVVSWDESIIKIDKRIETYHELKRSCIVNCIGMPPAF